VACFTRIIDRNTTIPTKKSQVFLDRRRTTRTPSPSASSRARREMAADNKVLGQFDLMGIPPSPRGMPQIEGDVRHRRPTASSNVSAKDKATGKEQQIRIQGLRRPVGRPTSRRWSRTPRPNAGRGTRKRREAVDAKEPCRQPGAFDREGAGRTRFRRSRKTDRRAIEDAVSDLKEALKGDRRGGDQGPRPMRWRKFR